MDRWNLFILAALLSIALSTNADAKSLRECAAQVFNPVNEAQLKDDTVATQGKQVKRVKAPGQLAGLVTFKR